MKDALIYILRDPDTKEIRYVGKTEDLHKRLVKHCSPSRLQDSSHRSNWIRKLLKAGKRPIMELVATVPFSTWEKAECYFIKLYRSQGHDLTNTHDGGKGGCSSGEKLKWNEETRRKHQVYMEETGKENLSRKFVGRNDAKNKTSRFLGVQFRAKRNHWRAMVYRLGKCHEKVFKTEEEAARWRDQKALELYGEGVPLNFP